MLTFVLTLILLLCIYIAYFWKYLVLYGKIGGYNPIPLSIPLSLNSKTMIFYSKNILGNNSKYCFYLVWMGPVPAVVSICPELCKVALNDSRCENKSKIYRHFARFLGPGLLTINNPEWSQIKRILNPAFRQTVLQNYFIPIFNKQVDILIQNIKEDLNKEGDTDLLLHLGKCVYDIATETIMGKEGFVQRNNDTHVLEIFFKIPAFVSEKLLTIWYHNNSIYNLTRTSKIADKYVKRFKDLCRTILTEKRLDDEIKKNEKIDKDGEELVTNKKIAVDFLYEQYKGNKISYEQFQANMAHLMAGAFETTSFTFFCILLCLAMYPDYQEKVFQEIYEKFPKKEFQITSKDLGDLKFLNMFINEVQRLIPSIPFLARQVEKDILFQNDILIPKGTTLAIDIFNLHRNPKYWGPNAEIFNPYNFLPDNIKSIHPYAFIPFSKGNRTCIGERYGQNSLRVMSAKVIRNFQFSTDCKFEDLRFQMDIVLKLQEYPKISVRNREQ